MMKLYKKANMIATSTRGESEIVIWKA